MLLRLQNTTSSMNELVRLQDRTANNLANAATVGYKRDRTFTAALNERQDEELAPRTDRRANQWVDLSQGPLEVTDNPMDLALDGAGLFFTTTDAAGAVRYTRAGQFLQAEDGTLKLPNGLTLQGERGPITVPPDALDLKVQRDGTVTADGQPLDRLRLVRIEDPTNLVRLDGATFAAAEGFEPPAAPDGVVKQGYLELSNVSPVGEMTEMIGHLRLFETQQKMISTTDQVLSQITRDLGRY